MTQFIAPNMAAAMQYSNQQGMMPSNQYASGILSMADGGFIGGSVFKDKQCQEEELVLDYSKKLKEELKN